MHDDKNFEWEKRKVVSYFITNSQKIFLDEQLKIYKKMEIINFFKLKDEEEYQIWLKWKKQIKHDKFSSEAYDEWAEYLLEYKQSMNNNS